MKSIRIPVLHDLMRNHTDLLELLKNLPKPKWFRMGYQPDMVLEILYMEMNGLTMGTDFAYLLLSP